MAKRTPLETDLTRLKKKVATRTVETDNPEGDAKFRALHKRLKRIQRKQRRQVIRKRHAMGKKAGEGAKTETRSA